MAEQWWFVISFVGFIVLGFTYLHLSTTGFFERFKRKKNVEHRKNK